MSEYLQSNYQIIREIGKGGMGEVYLAKDLKLDREVAIKLLNIPEFIQPSAAQTFIERFLQEAKAVARLNHPNIITIYDVSREQNHYYMVMEYVRGKTLSQFLQQDNWVFSSRLVCEVACQVCKAMAYAHEQGVIHRDIKPENIMFTRDEQIKLMDFGIAKLAQSENLQMTQAGDILGSIIYSSPEQLQASERVDLRTDIYSLGVTLYELATGKLPYQASSTADLIVQILTNNNGLKTDPYLASLPFMLTEIIRKAMAQKPEDRYQNMNEMLKDLESIPQDHLLLSTSDSELKTELTSSGIKKYLQSNQTTQYTVNQFLQDVKFSEDSSLKKAEILSKLRQAKSAHIKWRAYAQALVAGIPGSEENIPMVHTNCDFGKWYYGDGQELSSLASYTAIATPHETLHLVYMQMYKILVQEDPRKGLSKIFVSKEKAKEKQQAEVEKMLSHLISVSETLLAAIQQLEEEIKGIDEHTLINLTSV